jgi:hypothetical protein
MNARWRYPHAPTCKTARHTSTALSYPASSLYDILTQPTVRHLDELMDSDFAPLFNFLLTRSPPVSSRTSTHARRHRGTCTSASQHNDLEYESRCAARECGELLQLSNATARRSEAQATSRRTRRPSCGVKGAAAPDRTTCRSFEPSRIRVWRNHSWNTPVSRRRLDTTTRPSRRSSFHQPPAPRRPSRPLSPHGQGRRAGGRGQGSMPENGANRALFTLTACSKPR